MNKHSSAEGVRNEPFLTIFKFMRKNVSKSFDILFKL